MVENNFIGTTIKYRAAFFSDTPCCVNIINTKNPVLISIFPIFPCPYQHKHINHQGQGQTTYLVSKFYLLYHMVIWD